MFCVVTTEEPDSSAVVLTSCIWPLLAKDDDKKDPPEHVVIDETDTTVVFRPFGKNAVWELTCRVPDCAENTWLIVFARHSNLILGYFPLPNGSKNTTQSVAPKPVQLISSQPQHQKQETDIDVFAVQTSFDCDNFHAWLLQTGGYASIRMIGENDRTNNQHLMIVRTLTNSGIIDDRSSSSSSIHQHGNMLLSRSETAVLLTKTNILRLTLAIVQWTYNPAQFSNIKDKDIDVMCALEDQNVFMENLPNPIEGNLDIPLGAALPVVTLLAWRAIYMAFLTLCCVARGCTDLTCLSDVKNFQLVIEHVHKNDRVLCFEDSALEFLKNPRSERYDKNLFYCLVSLAIQMPPEKANDLPFLLNIRRLLQLYLP